MSHPGHERHDGSTGDQDGRVGQPPQPAEWPHEVNPGAGPSGYGPGGYASPGYGQGAYNPGDDNPVGYGQPTYGQTPYEAPGQGQPAGYGQQGYGPDAYAQNAYPQDPYGQAGYGYGAAAPGWPAQPGENPTLDQPHYGIGPVDAVKRVFKKYARFDGRASRSEYWWWVLAVSVVYLVLGAVFSALAGSTGTPESISPGAGIFGILILLVMLAVIVPSIAVAVRRLHDAGFSGWLYLISLIPYVGGLVLIILTALPSKPEGARFDKRPAGPGYYQG